MPRAILVVNSQPSSPARQGEFEDWYDNTHIPQVLTTPGFIGGRRFRLHDGGGDPGTASAQLVIYELDADDPMDAVAELQRRALAGGLASSDVIASDPAPTPLLYVQQN
jgi:hypothetical protein